uniref:26S proteasome non-ATPase regulatory subunit 4 n=1 Tax=Timema tahoe TaxID=61484 RepID=A0A7R9P151_9NEOP|nr:unnamed protein product [Timema tahoe]
MSLEGGEEERIAPVAPDFATMSEEEQIAFAMQMSMQDAQDQPGTKDPAVSGAGKKDTGMDKEESTPMEVEGDDDYEVMNDPEFLQSVLENLPGVDPQSEAIRQAVGSLSKDKVVKKDEDKDKDKSKK